MHFWKQVGKHMGFLFIPFLSAVTWTILALFIQFGKETHYLVLLLLSLVSCFVILFLAGLVWELFAVVFGRRKAGPTQGT